MFLDWIEYPAYLAKLLYSDDVSFSEHHIRRYLMMFCLLRWHISSIFFSVQLILLLWLNNLQKSIMRLYVNLKITHRFIIYWFGSVQFSSSVVSNFLRPPWIAAHQASLSITNSWSSLRLTSIESVLPSSHLILCRPLLLLPPTPPSIRVFSNESTLRMR